MKLAKRLLEEDNTKEGLASHVTRVLDQNIRHVLDIWTPSKVMDHLQHILKTFKLKLEILGQWGFNPAKDSEDRAGAYTYRLLSSTSGQPSGLSLEISFHIMDGKFNKFRYVVRAKG